MGGAFRMSYLLRPGPPKAPKDLEPSEGLTDILVVHSVRGIPGGPGALSVQTYQIGPAGAEPLSAALSVTLATMLLSGAVERSDVMPPGAGLSGRITDAAAAALHTLREPFRR